MSLSDKIVTFYKDLKIPNLPDEVVVLNPQKDPEVMKLVKTFFDKFYAEQHPRNFMIGINPGRHGGGITGINFTGPRQLRNNCGIEHSLGNSSELSAEFIYEVIEAYGGATKFYHDWFVTAVSPLGFVQDGKNLNYYDSRKLQDSLVPFINDCLDKQFSFGFSNDRCICIGEEKNYKFLHQLNEQRKKDGLVYFKEIIPVPHPRFILQYRRKQKDQYIGQYLEALRGK